MFISEPRYSVAAEVTERIIGKAVFSIVQTCKSVHFISPSLQDWT